MSAPEPAVPAVDRARQMEALLGSSALGFATGSATGIVEANAELLRMLGRTAAEVAEGLPWASVTTLRNERSLAALDQVRRAGDVLVSTELRRADGSTLPVLVGLIATSWDPFTWVAVIVDLFEEERLARLAWQEAAIVSGLLENAPVGFAFISPDLRFVRVNREIAAMNGHSVEAHEGAFVFDLLPDLREAAEPILRGVLETGEPVRDVEIVGRTPADPGHEHTWVESFFPLRSANGPIVGVAAIARDETEVRALQAELARQSQSQQWALEQLQDTLLPDRLPHVEGYAVAARYLPASGAIGLGGDWYDLIEARSGTFVATVGDVVGHGLEALGLMAQASGASRAYASEGHRPGEVLGELNTLLCRAAAEGISSAVILALEAATGEVEYARAGHPFPVLADAQGGSRVLDDAHGRLLGILPEGAYRAARTTLEPGATMLLYTDGLVERRTEVMTAGIERAARALAAGADEDLETALDRVLAECLDGQRRDDDVCLLAVRRLGRAAAS